MNNKNRKNSHVAAYDPTGQLKRDVIRIVQLHTKHNPDSLDLDDMRQMELRSGITAMIKHLVKKELSRLENLELNEQ
jgi:hypothetical protein